jgi:hypothetical protein
MNNEPQVVQIKINNFWSYMLSVCVGVAAVDYCMDSIQAAAKAYAPENQSITNSQLILKDPETKKLDTLEITGQVRTENGVATYFDYDTRQDVVYPLDRVHQIKMQRKPSP